MTEETLKFANMLKEEIDKLDQEIYDLMGIKPTVRSNFVKTQKFRRRRLQSIIRGKLKIKADIEVELSNEDVRALIDIRTAEQEALKQLLKRLE